VREVDRAMVGFGMPMGPFALLDQIGIDVAAKVAGVLKEAFPQTPGDSRLLHAMMQAGLLGVITNDLITPVATAILLAVTTLASSYLPARRAASVDPMAALRTE